MSAVAHRSDSMARQRAMDNKLQAVNGYQGLNLGGHL